MENLFKRKPIQDLPMIYAYDQRGKELDDIHGIHVHLVLNRKRITDGKMEKPFPIKAAFKAVFKSVMDNVNDPHKLKMLDLKTNGDAERCSKYVMGEKSSKKGKDKSANVETTQQWLKMVDREIFYWRNHKSPEPLETDGKTEMEM